MIEHALRYGELGLRIFPLEPGTKKPLVAKWPETASSDPDQIRGWWTRTPDAGIGLACGDELAPGRFLLVLDLDRHDGGADGVEAWNELSIDVDAPQVLTPSDGIHLYVTTPEPFTNSRGDLPDGIDVRGRGGFVILPPSSHPNGGTYEHELSATLGELPIPEAPVELLDVLRGSPEPEKTEKPTPTPSSSTNWDALDDRPGTEWANRTEWKTLLAADGWQHVRTVDGVEEWTRPGKDPRDGISATVNYGGADRLVVHSTNAPIPPESYSKLGYLAAARFGGDFSAASRSIAPAKPTPTKTDVDDPKFPEPDHGEEWPLPTPISRDQAPEPFPIVVFPKWIRDQIEQAAAEMQLDPDLPAMLALGALSTVLGGRAKVTVSGSYEEPVNLYLVVALPPGAGKSPVFKMMLERALGAFERELDEGGARDRELAGYLRKAAEKALDRAIQSGETDAIRDAHDELDSHVEPVRPKLFVDDVTTEKLAMLMRDQGGRLALISAEGGLFDQMTGRYSEGANLDPYLFAWSGDTVRVDRVGRDEVRVYDPALTIALTVQPAVIEKLAEKPELRGRGLTARFMFSYPTDRVGDRDFDEESSYSKEVELTYSNELLDLARVARMHHETDPLPLRLDPEAARLIRAMKNEHEPRLRFGGDLYEMREWVTKAQSSTVRVAGLLHLAERTGELVIGPETVRKALLVLDYWIAHARRVHDLFSADEELSLARRLLDHVLLRVDPGGTFTLRDVTQWSRTGEFNRTEKVIGPISELVELGYFRPEFEEPLVPRRGRTFEFTVNPRTRTPSDWMRERYGRATEQAHPRLNSTHSTTGSANDDHGERSSESMSLMSQETDRESLSPSRDKDEDRDAGSEAQEAQEAQLLDTTGLFS